MVLYRNTESHAGQTTLYLTPLHDKAGALKALIANIGAALQHVKATAERFANADPWATLLRYLGARVAPALRPFKPPVALAGAG